MNEVNNSPNCERATDLLAFLYDEANDQERSDFEIHLRGCAACRAELASFGMVRESIIAWRDEALSGFTSTAPATTAITRKSALAALRQFFDLSPLWLKGATAFSVVAFGVLAALVFVRMQTNNEPVPPQTNAGAVYTQQDVDRIVKEALAKQIKSEPEAVAVVESPKPRRAQSQIAKSRRPLSRAEREQLAADLRLLSTRDDADFNLLGDRINQE